MVMDKVTFFLMGEKGFAVLQRVFQCFGNKVIARVIAAEDKAMQKDYYQEILDFCSVNKISFHNRSEARAIETPLLLVGVG